MKFLKTIFSLFLIVTVAISCKSEPKKEVKKEEVNSATLAKAETLSLNISGMTCEMGCAKTIESKLVKKEGVYEAKVVFNDSIATIKYNGDKLNKTDLMAFIESVGDGESYKVSETSKMNCEKDCKNECCKTNKTQKKTCEENCKKECCKTEKA
ncbi:cation transporter [Tenacibaculum sp. ZS6-P6]|uniref:cation transporter n=1 Tax=Tenacibaculum sp. ZS6-P6 TaxID=3447503 RepID=UPI003F98906A